MCILRLYSVITSAASPLLPLYLRLRQRRGKEDEARLGERLGRASLPRPEGALLWMHAASVGEALSLMTLIELLRMTHPNLSLLMTTGTVTSARLMAERLPQGVMHQYVPLDSPAAARRFMAHWRPQIALWAESELWPNLIFAARESGCRLFLVNARLSERSFRRWKRGAGAARRLLAAFEGIFAQSEADGVRFQALGGIQTVFCGNLKEDAPPLPAGEAGLQALLRTVGSRPRFVAASTHEGEEERIARAFCAAQQEIPALLLAIVPRHPARGREIADKLRAAHPEIGVQLRSREPDVSEKTGIYIADTMGELGLFYRAFPLAFIGGSLIPHGGQNVLEAARLGAATLFGPHMFNFSDVATGLLQAGGARQVTGGVELSEALSGLLSDPSKAAAMRARAQAFAETRGGATARLLAALSSALEETAHAPRT